jgi:hypothetical protein
VNERALRRVVSLARISKRRCVQIRHTAQLAAATLMAVSLLACENPQVALPPEEPAQQPPDVSLSSPPWANRVSKNGGFPCRVDAVLALSCRRCHYEPPENDAPFPLMKYEDIEVMRSGKPIRQLMEQMVAADLMPPLDEPVQPKVTPLTLEQKNTLLGWLRAGAPKNPERCP